MISIMNVQHYRYRFYFVCLLCLVLSGWGKPNRVLAAPQILPTDDSFVDPNEPAKNYNAGQLDGGKLLVGYSNFGTLTPVQQTLLQFNVSAISSASDQSDVVLSIIREDLNGVNMIIGLYQVTDDSWDEQTVTQNNAPSIGALLQTITINDGQSGEIRFDNAAVGAFIEAQRNADGIVSFLLRTESASGAFSGSISLEDRENSGNSGNEPYIDILPEPPVMHILTVNKTGNGTVTSNPPGIDCGNDCTEAYISGTQVTLIAMQASGSNFTGWSGACAGTGSCVVTMDAAKNVIATFTLNPPTLHTLTVSKAGNGNGTVTSNPSGIDCGGDCTEAYASGTQVTLVAAQASGSNFTGWSGACAGTGSCVVTMDAAKSVIATFTFNPPTLHTLTVSKAGNGNGTVTSSPAGIDCGNDCTEAYTSGTQVTLTAVQANGSSFAGWSGACTGTSSCVVTMDAAKSVIATFTLNPPTLHTLTVSKAGNGNGTVTSNPSGIDCGNDCTETYTSGTQVTLMATSASGSDFMGWSGACVGANPCVVTMDAAKSVTANFAVIPPVTYTLTVNKTGNGTVTSNPLGINCGNDCAEAYTTGTQVTLIAAQASGSNFTGWSGACTGTGSCVVTMDAAKNVIATFTLNPPILYTLTVSKAGNGNGTVTSNPLGINYGNDCTEAYTSGTQVTLTAAQASGSNFTGWSGACAGTGSCVVTMDTAKSVIATFTLNPPTLHTLTVSKAGAGSGTVTSNPSGINCGSDCTETYISDTQVTLTATPDSGSSFAGWSGNCTGTGNCVMTIDDAKSVIATFTGDQPPPPDGRVIYISSSSSGRVDGIKFHDEDILAYAQATDSWSMLFDGSDVKIGKTDIDAFEIMEDGSILLTLFLRKISGFVKDKCKISRVLKNRCKIGGVLFCESVVR